MALNAPYRIDKVGSEFGCLVMGLYKYLEKEHKEYVIGRQILRSGTSVGANITEAQAAQSKKDFLHEVSIALKEAKETQYRLGLISDAGLMIHYSKKEKIVDKINELVGVLTKIIKTTKINLSIQNP